MRIHEGDNPGLDDLPGPPRTPVEGTLLHIDGPDMHERLKAWVSQYGPMYVFWQGCRPIVVVSDPALIAEVLRRRPAVYRRMGTIESVCREMEIHSVFSAEGDEWSAQRPLVLRSFGRRFLRRFHPQLSALVDDLRLRWSAAADSGAAVDVQSDLMRFSLDVITRFALGHDLGSAATRNAVHGHLQTILDALFRRVHAPSPTWRTAPGEAEVELQRALEAVKGHLRQALEGARDRARKGDPPTTYLDAMLAEPPGPMRYDVERLLGNSMIMLLAGEDAVANVMTWMFDTLCRLPEIARRLSDEVDAVLGDESAPSFDQLDEMPYGRALIDETCRLRPADESLFMETAIEATLGGHRLPAGTPLFLMIRPCMADPRHFDEPQTVDPARWLSGARPERAHDTAAYMPFGYGPRFCPGRGLAYHQARLVAAMVARHFLVDFAGDDAVPDEEWGFIMAPRGLRVRFAHRRPDGEQLP